MTWLGKLGIKESEIRKHENLSKQEFNTLMMSIKDEVFANQKKGLKTWVFFHYGGHGLMNNGYTEVVCNSRNPLHLRFPLEQNLRLFGETEKGIYITAVFDCCRSQVQECMRPGPAPLPPGEVF